MADSPNIVTIILHDLGDFLPHYGRIPMATPNIDRIASAGVVLENHFATAAVCSPSRGSCMTGCYPHTNGLMGLVHRGWALDVDNHPTLPVALRRAGYRSALIGFQHEHYDAARLGYDVVRPCAPPFAERVAPLAAEWLAGPEAKRGPFYLSVGFTEVHRLGMNPSGWRRDAYTPAAPGEVSVPPFLPDVPEVRQELAGLYGAIRHADECTGVVLDALDRSGLSDNTLVIFTTDHGISIIHAKATLYDGGIKVACLMRWPRGIPGSRRLSTLTSHVDLLPTLCEVAGAQPPAAVDGRSFAALLRGEGDTHREFVFAESDYTNSFAPTRAVRSRDRKLIRKGVRSGVFDFLIPEVELCETDFRKVESIRSFYSWERSTEELYDLVRDPGELRNLAADPAYAADRQRLGAALEAHLRATADPFADLRNAIQMPASYVNWTRA